MVMHWGGQPVFRIISIAFVALIVGGCTDNFYLYREYQCYEGKYEKATDLSEIKVGVLRADVEKLLGKPLAIRGVKNLFHPGYKTLAVYEYIGKPPPPEQAYIRIIRSNVDVCPPAKEQKILSLLIAYDGNDRVIADDRVIRDEYPEVPPYVPLNLALTRLDYQIHAHILNEKPAVTSASIAFIPTRRQREYWLCLNTYNRHAWALKEMGRRHWLGERGARQDKVLGFMWYSLAAKSDPTLTKMTKKRRRSLTPAGVNRGEQMVADWLRKWELRPGIYKPCNALPNW